MSLASTGLHHVTAIATRPQGNIEFYVRLLGLRLVKRTVNYDDPQTYHFYFGDALGRPGSVISFFPWPGSGPAVRGAGESVAVAFRVPPGALALWGDRLQQHGLAHTVKERFGEELLALDDPDGVPLELQEAPLTGAVPDNWPGAPVAASMAVQGLHSVTLLAPELDRTAELLERLGLRHVEEAPEPDTDGVRRRRVRLAADSKGFATSVDLLEAPRSQPSRLGAGSLHHVALRVADEAALQDARELLAELGLAPTKVKNRNYFKSVYFKEPGGAIVELATDGPGFVVDEPADELGLAFRLPAWLEQERDFLRGRLPVTASPEYADRFRPPE
ncbi:MAG: VOC family protein [Trueperaceae bacterium]